MIGRAIEPAGARSEIKPKLLLFCYTPMKRHFMKFLFEPLPLESRLQHDLAEHFNSEIVNGIITSKQQAVDWITWSFMYRRLDKNPNFYDLAGRTGEEINAHLSDMIE